MSNLFSYFQRIEPKKLASTTANGDSITQPKITPKRTNDELQKNKSTSVVSATKSRKSMNMSDVYSADSPKSEKRKQSSTIAVDDSDSLPQNKS